MSNIAVRGDRTSLNFPVYATLLALELTVASIALGSIKKAGGLAVAAGISGALLDPVRKHVTAGKGDAGSKLALDIRIKVAGVGLAFFLALLGGMEISRREAVCAALGSGAVNLFAGSFGINY